MLNDVEQISERAPEAVDGPRHHHIEPPPTGVLQHGIEAGSSVAPLGARDARVVVDLDYLPATPLGHLPKLADLIFHGLGVGGDPNIERCTLCLGHGRSSMVLRGDMVRISQTNLPSVFVGF